MEHHTVKLLREAANAFMQLGFPIVSDAYKVHADKIEKGTKCHDSQPKT
jgi:hypothetical protein